MSLKKEKHRNKHHSKKPIPATFYSSVLQSIRQHARGTPHIEICGVLIGRQSDEGTLVTGAVAGEGAKQGGAHVTFTQEAWVRIHEEKNKRYPGQVIVGWYHSHPGFGVFLSDHDIFIHKHFFTQPRSLAWVYDPHSDEEGCFGWSGGDVRRLVRFEIVTDTEKQIGSRSEPSCLVDSKELVPAPRYTFWRSLRNFCMFLLLKIAALLRPIVVSGWHVLRDSPLLHRIGKWFKQKKLVSAEQDTGEVVANTKGQVSVGCGREDGMVSKDSSTHNGRNV